MLHTFIMSVSSLVGKHGLLTSCSCRRMQVKLPGLKYSEKFYMRMQNVRIPVTQIS
jgi:hypothetical protein